MKALSSRQRRVWYGFALKVIRRLSNPDTQLKQRNTENWELYESERSTGKPALQIPTNSILALRAADFIRIDKNGRAHITDTGIKWAARQTVTNDRFLSQHQDRILRRISGETSEGRNVLFNQSENPLYRLYRRKDKNDKQFLSDKQFAAGERLRRDFTHAQLGQKTTASWSLTSSRLRTGRKHGGPKITGNEFSDKAIAARARFNKAIAGVGPEFAGILTEICCFLRGIGEAEDRFDWPRRSGKLVLRLALSSLARHYESLDTEPPREKDLLASWSQQNYRPSVQQPSTHQDTN